MRPFGWMLLPVMLCFPALAGAERPPFTMEEGVHRNVVLAPLGGSAFRLVLPAVSVERPSEDRAILRPGGDGRVVLQIMPEGGTGHRTGAVLHFGQAPLVMERRDGRVALAGSLKALSLPLTDDPDARHGTIAFQRMTFRLILPSASSPAMQEATISFQAQAMRVDPALLTVAMPGKPVVFSTVSLRAQAMLQIPHPLADIGQLSRSVRQVDLADAGADLSGNPIAARGTAVFGEDDAARLDGLLSLGNFAALLQTLMSGDRFAPEQIMPLALVAGGLGRMTEDGTLTFRVRTAEDGTLIINDRPATLPSIR